MMVLACNPSTKEAKAGLCYTASPMSILKNIVAQANRQCVCV